VPCRLCLSVARTNGWRLDALDVDVGVRSLATATAAATKNPRLALVLDACSFLLLSLFCFLPRRRSFSCSIIQHAHA
jgi:hypothetical protein